MAKQFKNIDALASYIKSSCHPKALRKIGDKGIDIMKDVTTSQVDGMTGDIISCIDITSIDNDSVEIKWQDNGSWYSVITGNHFYAPYGLEGGYTWGEGHTPRNPVYKPATTLEETSKEKIEQEAPSEYKKYMRSKGFKVK